MRTSDVNAWYADLSVTHQVSDAISYSLSVGHELRLGMQANTTEATYFRPNVTWKFIKDVTLQGSISYEHGAQDLIQQAGGVAETYDTYGAMLSLSRPITKKLTASMNYRLTLRSSNAASRGYTQDIVGLLLTYTFQ